MSDNETPETKRLIESACDVVREHADQGPDTEEILLMEIRWEMDEHADNILGLIMEIDDLRATGKGAPETPETAEKVAAIRKRQAPLYEQIAACHQRLHLIAQAFNRCPSCGSKHEDECSQPD